MNIETARQAADILSAAWRDKRTINALPDACRPATVDEGYAVQDALTAAMGHAVAGYKIGATNETVQAKFGVDRPISGRLFEPFVLNSPAEIAAGAVTAYIIEAEFAFRLAKDLPPRGRDYTVEEVMAATDALHPAIEIPDTRYEDWLSAGVAQLIADDSVAGFLVLAPPASDWRAIDLSRHPVVVRVNDETVSEGVGANVMGDPRTSLTWLVNDRAARGEGLKAGQVVTTGSAADVVKVKPGDVVHAEFGALGAVQVSFG